MIFFVLYILLGIFVFGLTNCDFGWTSSAWYVRSCKIGNFTCLGRLGLAKLLRWKCCAWTSVLKIRFFSFWIQFILSIWTCGMSVRLLLVTDSLFGEVFSSTTTQASSLFQEFPPWGLFCNVLIAPASCSSSEVTSTPSCLNSLPKPTTFFSLNTISPARVSFPVLTFRKK